MKFKEKSIRFFTVTPFADYSQGINYAPIKCTPAAFPIDLLYWKEHLHSKQASLVRDFLNGKEVSVKGNTLTLKFSPEMLEDASKVRQCIEEIFDPSHCRIEVANLLNQNNRIHFSIDHSSYRILTNLERKSAPISAKVRVSFDARISIAGALGSIDDCRLRHGVEPSKEKNVLGLLKMFLEKPDDFYIYTEKELPTFYGEDSNRKIICQTPPRTPEDFGDLFYREVFSQMGVDIPTLREVILTFGNRQLVERFMSINIDRLYLHREIGDPTEDGYGIMRFPWKRMFPSTKQLETYLIERITNLQDAIQYIEKEPVQSMALNNMVQMGNNDAKVGFCANHSAKAYYHTRYKSKIGLSTNDPHQNLNIIKETFEIFFKMCQIYLDFLQTDLAKYSNATSMDIDEPPGKLMAYYIIDKVMTDPITYTECSIYKVDRFAKMVLSQL